MSEFKENRMSMNLGEDFASGSGESRVTFIDRVRFWAVEVGVTVGIVGGSLYLIYFWFGK